MIKIEISDEMKKWHNKYFESKIKPNFDLGRHNKNGIIREKERLIGELFNVFNENSEKLAVGNFAELKKLHGSIEDIIQKHFQNKTEKERGTFNGFLLGLFGYKQFVDRKFPKMKLQKYNVTMDNCEVWLKKFDLEKHWSPYFFALMSKVRVCPYCNRQYITPIVTNSGRLRADLDHFLPKSKYPYFSMSLYNLIPCCKFCNSSLKRDNKIDLDDLHPYSENIGDYFHYKAIITDTKNSKLIVDYNEESKVVSFLEMFKIKELAGYHDNIGKEFIQKRLCYPEERLDAILDCELSLYKNKEHLKAAILGYVPVEEEINNEVLAKMKRDLAKQFGFIGEDEEKMDGEKLINKLRKMLSN